MLFIEGERKAEFLNAWLPLCASRELDGAVLDFHFYFFGSWVCVDHEHNEPDHGSIRNQIMDCKRDLAAVPAAVVGEWSAAVYGVSESSEGSRDLLNEYLRLQQNTYRDATHGHFYWNWSDSCFGWSRQASFFDGPT